MQYSVREGAGVGVLDIYGSTYTGSGWAYPVFMGFQTTETHSATNQGTRLVFSTTLTGGTSFAQRGEFSGNGNFLVGTNVDIAGPGKIRALGIEATPIGTVTPSTIGATTIVSTSTITANNSSPIFVNGAAGTDRIFVASTSGVTRWFWGANSAAESGANSGSNFQFTATDDSGGFLATWMNIERATGIVSFPGGLLSVVTTAPSGGTAQPWKLGNYTAGAAAQVGKVRVEINGTPYDLLTA